MEFKSIKKVLDFLLGKTPRQLSDKLLSYLEKLKKYPEMNDSKRKKALNQVKSLIDKGADLSAQDEYRYTPLHYATIDGHKEIVELLIAKGADVNAKDNNERTALYYAESNGHTETVELLENANAQDINKQMEVTKIYGGKNKGVKNPGE